MLEADTILKMCSQEFIQPSLRDRPAAHLYASQNMPKRAKAPTATPLNALETATPSGSQFIAGTATNIAHLNGHANLQLGHDAVVNVLDLEVGDVGHLVLVDILLVAGFEGVSQSDIQHYCFGTTSNVITMRG